MSTAQADSLYFNFSPSAAAAGNVGPSEDYTVGGVTLTAYGFVKATGAASSLYQKYTPGDASETGLGLAADSDHEIPPPFFVQLDVQNLINAGFTSLSLQLGSLQNGEQANIYKDNTPGSFGDGFSGVQLLGAGGADVLFKSVSLTNRYINITGGGSAGADPVLMSATANVPDGGSTALLVGGGLLAAAMISRRRQGRAASSN